MIRGEADVGKTALLAYLREHASGPRRLGRGRPNRDGAGVRSAPPALRTDANRLPRLPEPQRDELVRMAWKTTPTEEINR
jgi:hypothetical protein